MHVSTRALGKLAEVFYSLNLKYKKVFKHPFLGSGNFEVFWVNLGIFGNFGQEKPCTDEDAKGFYKPKKKWFQIFIC